MKQDENFITEKGQRFLKIGLVFALFVGVLIEGVLVFTATEVNSVIKNNSNSSLATRIRAALEQKFSGDNVSLLGQVEWIRGVVMKDAIRVELVSEIRPGRIVFEAVDRDGVRGQGIVDFKITREGWAPMTRILPGTRLNQEMFTSIEIDTTKGQNRENRGLIVSKNEAWSMTESRQTLIEGQPVISSQLQKIPDVGRGDVLKVRFITGDVELMTSGVAQEPGQLNQKIQVLTQKTKRVFSGTIKPEGWIEVQL